MAKKKMDAEERKEYKGGKYMGGPAEERAEKKKGKRMAVGGPAGYGGTNTNDPAGRGGYGGTGLGGVSGGVNAGGGDRGGPAGGVTTGTRTGTTASNRPAVGPGMGVAAQPTKPIRGPARPAQPPKPTMPSVFYQPWNDKMVDFVSNMRQRYGSGNTSPEGRMRGGGLAKKGVGQALNKGGKVKCMASGGLVKGAGCAQRGVKKARNV